MRLPIVTGVQPGACPIYSVPDEELLEAAEKGELHARRGREREVERMLASPRLESGVRAFFDDMFAFDHFDSLSKDPQKYPMITGATLQDAREQIGKASDRREGDSEG